MSSTQTINEHTIARERGKTSDEADEVIDVKTHIYMNNTLLVRGCALCSSPSRNCWDAMPL